MLNLAFPNIVNTTSVNPTFSNTTLSQSNSDDVSRMSVKELEKRIEGNAPFMAAYNVGNMIYRVFDEWAPEYVDNFHGNQMLGYVEYSNLVSLQEYLKLYGSRIPAYHKDRALRQASINNNPDIVRLLLDHPTCEAITPQGIGEALKKSAVKGHCKVVSTLLNHNKSKLILPCDINGALYEAASNGHLDVVEILLDHMDSLNLDKKNCLVVEIASLYSLFEPHQVISAADKGLALWGASWHGHTGVVQLLLRRYGKKIKPHYITQSLYLAGACSHFDIVQMLLNDPIGKKAIKLHDLGEALVNTVIKGTNHEVLELLKHPKGKFISQKDLGKALYFAAETNNLEKVELLLNHPLGKVISVQQKMAALKLALDNNRLEIVNKLLLSIIRDISTDPLRGSIREKAKPLESIPSQIWNVLFGKQDLWLPWNNDPSLSDSHKKPLTRFYNLAVKIEKRNSKFQQAARAGQHEVVQQMLAQQGHLLSVETISGALRNAVRYNLPQAVKTILDHPAAKVVPSTVKEQLLNSAVYYADPNVAEMLLEHPTDKQISLEAKRNALIWAAIRNRPQSVKTMLSHFSAKNLVISGEAIALAHQHAKKNGYDQVAELLSEYTMQRLAAQPALLFTPRRSERLADKKLLEEEKKSVRKDTKKLR